MRTSTAIWLVLERVRNSDKILTELGQNSDRTRTNKCGEEISLASQVIYRIVYLVIKYNKSYNIRASDAKTYFKFNIYSIYFY